MTLTWVLAGIGVLLGCALIVAAFFVGRRSRRGAAPAPKAASLADAWKEITRQLPVTARSRPLVVVLGERGAGKSCLIRRVFAYRSAFAGEPTHARDDSRVTAFTPGPLLIQEIAGELFEAEGSDTLAELHELWQPMALEIALVVFVSTTETPPERQAQRMRRMLDLLTDLRGGSAPRCSVCFTHLDESAEGFADIVASARLGPVDPSSAGLVDTWSALRFSSGAELLKLWDERFRDCYYGALGGLSGAEFVRAMRFPEQSGPELSRYVDALLRSAFRGRTGAALPFIAFSAMPGEEKLILFGDPFAPDDDRLKADRVVLERRRLLHSAGVAAMACGLITMLYAWHNGTLQRAEQAVTALSAAATRAQAGDQKLLNAITAEPEIQAASALDSALTPIYLPLRLAFPTQKSSAVSAFLTEIQDLHLLPLTLASDRATRVAAAALLYSSRDNALGRAVLADSGRFTSVLQLSRSTVEHYVNFSRRAYQSPLRAVELPSADVAAQDWAAFLTRIDSVLSRGRLERAEELAELQEQAARLSAAMRWAVQEPELRPLIQLLEVERGRAEVQALLAATNGAALEAPPWVHAQRDALQSVLSLVQKSEVTVPNAQGKSLRQALVDLDRVALPGPLGSGPSVKLEFDGSPHEYRPELWTSVLSQSRATFYVDALLKDLEGGRSLFFSEVKAYPNVPASAVLGRGASTSLAGFYTRAAFNGEIKTPLEALSAKLDAVKLPDSERTRLKSAIQRQIEIYARGLSEALFAYLKSFRFEAADVSTLRAAVGTMTSGSAWFADFWGTISKNAGLDLGENDALQPIERAVAPFAPVVALAAEDKGTYPNLQPYSAILVKLLPALEGDPLVPSQLRGGALADRVSPIGKLGIALLDEEKPGPVPEVEDFLTKSNVLDDVLREPFRAPVRSVVEHALRSVEQVAGTAYTRELGPMLLPLVEQFPFDPGARTDAPFADVQAVLAPKGQFTTAFGLIFDPLTRRNQRHELEPRKVAGYRAVALPREALSFGNWVASLGTILWSESGEPKPIPFYLRPASLPSIRPGAEDAATLAVLRSGATTLAGFNQTTSVSLLPVEWWTASPAEVGVEFSSVDGSTHRALSLEASGSAWRFFHLLCRGRFSHGVARWFLGKQPEREVAFELRADPWANLVSPNNRGRQCPASGGKDGT